ncbi:MAG: transglycosylase SLT domain-containing protein [Chitinophagales bacterium]
MINYLDDKSFIKGIIIILIMLLFYPYINSLNSVTKLFQTKELYLKDKASIYVRDIDEFEKKVRRISSKLDIHPDWLMAIMHSESKLDASVVNLKGSGATGLIQFLPTTAINMDITVEQMRNLNHIQQLDYVYEYLRDVQKTRKVSFENITDLYLSILYPVAVGQEAAFVLYRSPSSTYQKNSGLDENHNGEVSVKDIDLRMKRLYPIAYQATLSNFQFGFTFYCFLVMGILFFVQKKIPLQRMRLVIESVYRRISNEILLRIPRKL